MITTRLVLTVKHLTYKERLVQLKLPTLKYRRLRGDIIFYTLGSIDPKN